MRRVRATIVAEEKQRVTYSECASVALAIQHSMRMRLIVICDLSGSTIFFSHYLIKNKLFGKKVTEDKMCVLIFSTIVV
jgi:hypothetical protein